MKNLFIILFTIISFTVQAQDMIFAGNTIVSKSSDTLELVNHNYIMGIGLTSNIIVFEIDSVMFEIPIIAKIKKQSLVMIWTENSFFQFIPRKIITEYPYCSNIEFIQYYHTRPIKPQMAIK